MTTLTATLNYLVPSKEKPIYIASKGGEDAQLSISAKFEPHRMRITDARTLDQEATLDIQGFTLCQHPTAVNNFYKFNDHQTHYEDEISKLVLEQTGGKEVAIFDHTLRSDSALIRGQQHTREPATVIHNDYSDASALKRLRDLLPEKDVAKKLEQRYCIINVWRSINKPVTHCPLACADARTVEDDDRIASERRAEERIGELELVRFNPQHQWFYYSAMERDEVLLIKTFDSATDGRARRSIHTAFNNESTSLQSSPRESIESRMFVFY